MKEQIKPIQLTVETTLEPLDEFALEPVDHTKQERRVYLDNQRAPDFIEKAILHYMDYNMNEYLNYIENRMENEN